MLGNLKNPPEPFGDIVRTHYRLKSRAITAQLDAWLAQDDGKATNGGGVGYTAGPGELATAPGGSKTSFQRDVDEMKRMLKELERDN